MSAGLETSADKPAQDASAPPGDPAQQLNVHPLAEHRGELGNATHRWATGVDPAEQRGAGEPGQGLGEQVRG